MAYHQLESEPVNWVRAVRGLFARWRSGSTPVWHGIQAYEASEHPPIDLGEFGRLLDSMRSGNEGVALFALGPMLSLVTQEESNSNMPHGADDLVRRWALGQTVASTTAVAPSARPDVVDLSVRPAGTTAPDASRQSIIPSWLWGLLGGVAAVGLLWYVRARSNQPARASPTCRYRSSTHLLPSPSLPGRRLM